MAYAEFMRSIAVRAYAAVIEKHPDKLFLVLDDLKEHVERHPFDQGTDLTEVLRNYPCQKIDNLSFWVEEDPNRYVCRCENPYPFATELIIESDTKSKNLVVSMVESVSSMLQEPSEEEFFGFCTLSGKGGNRYRVGLDNYANAVAHLSVYHKTVPSHKEGSNQAREDNSRP